MINDIINKHLPKAFDNQLNDAVKPFAGSRQGDSSYDPVLDEYISDTSVTYQGRGVFGSYNNLEMQDTQVNINDTKLTCLQIEVDNTPKIDDKITQDNKEYKVINVSKDPADATWTMQLRGLDDVE